MKIRAESISYYAWENLTVAIETETSTAPSLPTSPKKPIAAVAAEPMKPDTPKKPTSEEHAI